MRKSSTGERVDIDAVRMGVSQLMSHGNGVVHDQLMVEQLMNTTPSSSFDEDEWRDGFVYNRPCDSQAESPPPPGLQNMFSNRYHRMCVWESDFVPI